MPWQEQSRMSLRLEFVTLAAQPDANIRQLCRRFAISPTTGYTWLARFRRQGTAGLVDQSRRPHHSPTRTAPATEAAILAVRQQHPAWGARKIARWLTDQGGEQLPAASTITAILARHGGLDPTTAAQHRAYTRFVAAAPNDLWQIDFKGHFPLTAGGRCHPLSVLDDHSRFLLGLVACGDERACTVQTVLTGLFARYGLPARILLDNGSPWGDDTQHRHTVLTVWLWRLGIAVSHTRVRHPQTQGKVERLHRTLERELLAGRVWRDLAACQTAFTWWRTEYNSERPHAALALATPLSRYTTSPRSLPIPLPPFDYAADAVVRTVQRGGDVSFGNQRYRVGKAFVGQRVEVRATTTAGRWAVYCGRHPIATIVVDDGAGGA